MPKNMKTKSPLPWFGSDAGVAAELAELLDECKHVTIPFAGGLSILPHLKARSIVANDMHEAAINFYRVASGSSGDHMRKDLIERCKSTLSHPVELDRAKSIVDELSRVTVLENGKYQYHRGSYAWAFWALCWIGRKGKGGTKHQGGNPSIRRTANGGNNATRISSAAADLHLWTNELKRCEFECEDFRDCLDSIADKPDCGIYCDPPWFGAGRNYLHGFTDQDHSTLAECLSEKKHSPIVLRYGDCDEVRSIYEPCDDWTIVEAKSRTQANKSLGELWITKNIEVEVTNA